MNRTTDSSRATAVFCFFAMLGLVYSWPLALWFSGAIPYSLYPDPAHYVARMFQGDHLQAYYHISLLKLAVTGDISWFSNPFEFATKYMPPGSSDYFLPMSLVYLPFSFISGPMAYNVMIIVSFGLGGLSMYLWARRLTGSWLAGLSAGLVFDLVPDRLVELLGGHPSGHAVFLFPLTLYFFDRAVAEKNLRYSALAGLCTLALSIQYNYFSYYLLMFLMVYIPWRVVPAVWNTAKGKEGKTGLSRLTLAGVPFAIGLLGAIGYMLHFKNALVGKAAIAGGRSLSEVALYSPALSGIIDQRGGWNIYLGLALLAVPFAIWFGFSGGYQKRERRDAIFFSLVFLLSYTLAFGTTLDSLLPVYSFFYNHFPYFDYSRAPTKIMIISVSAISILFAYFVKWISGKRHGALTASLLMIVTAVDYHSFHDIGICPLDEGNRIYRQLAEQAGGRSVVNIPIWPGESSWSSIYTYYALQSRVRTINGYSPLVSREYIDKVFWPLAPVNSGDLSDRQAKLLKEFNVGYLVFHNEAYPPKISAYPSALALNRLVASPYLELVDSQDPLWLFKLIDKPANRSGGKVTSPVGTFFQAEQLNRINGTPVKDEKAMNGWALAGYPNAPPEERILNAGPYKTFPSGSYKAIFRIKTPAGRAGENRPVVKIDVAGDLGKVILAHRTISNYEFNAPDEYQDFTLDYTLTPSSFWQVEFRTYIVGDAPVFIDSVYVLFADQTDPDYHYEAEDLFHTGQAVKDAGAEGGSTVMTVPGRDPAGLMLYGPSRMFDAGDYRAKVRMKSDSPKTGPDGPLASIVIYSVNNDRAIAKREVSPADLREAGAYGNVNVPFTLAGKDVVELRVYSRGHATLYADSVTIKPER